MVAVKNVLALPSVYRLFHWLIGADRWRRRLVNDYLCPQAGERILDIGCGPADILAHFPEVDYLGIDLSAAYIEEAKNRFGARGQFQCRAVDQVVLEQTQSFDLVMAVGLLHHLSDEEARTLMRLAASGLKPGGRLFTVDPCFHDGQTFLARWVVSHDRGQFVRRIPEYEALARAAFGSVKGSLRTDMVRLPHGSLIMECRRPLSALQSKSA